MIKTGSPTSANAIYAAMNVSLVPQHISSIDLSQCKDYSVLVEQELPTLPEHLSSPPYFSGFYVFVLQLVICLFVLFLLAIVLSVLLRVTDSNYPFCIFKLFEHIGKPNDMKVLESK